MAFYSRLTIVRVLDWVVGTRLWSITEATSDLFVLLVGLKLNYNTSI